MSILAFLAPLVSPIAKIFQKKQDRKIALDSIKGKLAQAKQNSNDNVLLSKAEWELAGQKLQDGTWKDEFITIVVFAPFITALVGAVLSVFGMPELSQAASQMMVQISGMNIEYGNLLYVTALAGLGLRAIKG
jgi:hypothetical protein